MMMMMIINKKIHKMHEKCIFYKFSVFFKFQFFNSVMLKNTEKKFFFFLNKYISVFQVNFTEKNFQFQCFIFSVSVKNFSDDFCLLVIPLFFTKIGGKSKINLKIFE